MLKAVRMSMTSSVKMAADPKYANLPGIVSIPWIAVHCAVPGPTDKLQDLFVVFISRFLYHCSVRSLP